MSTFTLPTSRYSLFQALAKLTQCWKILAVSTPDVRLSLQHLLLPIASLFIAAACDGAAMALLGPLLQQVFSLGGEIKPLAGSASWQSGNTNSFSTGQLLFLILSLSILAIPLRKFAVMYLESRTKRVIAGAQAALVGQVLGYGKVFYLTTDTAAVQEACHQAAQTLALALRLLQRVAEGIAFISLYLIVMGSLSWIFVGYFLLGALILVSLSRYRRKKIAKVAHEELEQSKELTRTIVNSMRGIEVIKAGAKESVAASAVAQAAQEKLQSALEITRLNFITSALQEGLGILLVFVGVLLYIALGQESGSEASANIAVFVVVARRMLRPIAMLNSALLDASRLIPGVATLEQLLREDDKYIPYSGVVVPPTQPARIEFVNCNFTYPDGYQALKNISLSVPAGSSLAIVGRTGAGKTTLLNMLLKSFEIPAGEVFVDGIDLREIDRKSWAHRVAFVSQNNTLVSATLRENLTLFDSATIDDTMLLQALERVALGNLVRQLPQGLDTLLGDAGLRISRGEQQRVAIARALLSEPHLVCIDEATASIDAHTEIEVLTALRTLRAGRTSIIVAHRLATIRDVDQIVVMEDGCVVEQGTFEELLGQSGVFQKLWQIQSSGYTG